MESKSCPKFHVKKRTLLGIAGTVWMIAGINVAKLGIIAYLQTRKFTPLNLFLSLIVFGAFSVLFYKMSVKHSNRIQAYEGHSKSFWHFFDLKSYIIMACMMSGGMWLRSSGLVSQEFIAVFYTGLGLALAFAGISFWRMFFIYPNPDDRF